MVLLRSLSEYERCLPIIFNHFQFSLLARRWRSGWRCGLAIDSVWLHQLDTRAIGIEQIRLTLPVDAGLDFNFLRIVLAGGPAFQNLDCLVDIWNHQTDMILGAELLGGWPRVVKHEFQIVVAIGHTHVDPAQFFWIPTAAPEFLEPQ